jgi:hypothetical protein
MDRQTICDCCFKDHCQTFSDPLIEQARKGAAGLGCRGQNDLHRARHCRTFRCASLSLVLNDLLKQPAPESDGQRG